jgi:hypothetical protein
LQSGSQSIRFAFSFGEFLDSASSSSGSGDAVSRKKKAFAAALLVVLLALLQEPLWLTTASPVLLYSLFSVAQERSSTTIEEIDDENDAADTSAAGASSSAAAASSIRRPSTWAERVATHDSPPAPHIGLLGCSIRMPTPSRPISITGSDRASAAAAADLELLQAAAASNAAAAAALASNAAAASSSSPRMSGAATSTAAIPFPSLLSPSPAPAGDPLGVAAMGPRQGQQGSSGLILVQPRPTRNVSDRSVLAAENMLANAAAALAAQHQQQSSSAKQSAVSPSSMRTSAVDGDEHKEQDVSAPAALSASSPRARRPSPSIAASLSSHPLPSVASASFQPLSVTLPPRRIDVHQALSRMSPAPASASKRRGHAHSQSQHSLSQQHHEDAAQSELSSADVSDAESSLVSEAERSFFADIVRRTAALESLPASAASSASFRMNFTFQFGFEDVLTAFLELGEHAAQQAAAAAAAAAAAVSSEREEPGASPYGESNAAPQTPRRRGSQTSSAAMAAEAFIGSGGGGGGANTPTSNVAAHAFALSDYVVDVISDSAAAEGASASAVSTTDVPPRFIVRRVQTPLSLPHLLRKLLGDVRHLSVEERVSIDSSRRREVKLYALSRSLGNFLSLASVQRIAPHPVHEGHTRWSVEVRAHVYSSCGLMRAQVQSFLVAAAKQRQHQISLLLSADIKRLVEKRKIEQAQAQQQQQQDDGSQKEEELFGPAGAGLGLTQRTAAIRNNSRADGSARAAAAASKAALSHSASTGNFHARRV